MNTEESYQTGFGKERRIKSLFEKDGFCLKKGLIKKDIKRKAQNKWKSLRRKSLIEKRKVVFKGTSYIKKNVRFEWERFYQEMFWLYVFEKRRRVKSYESCLERGRVRLKMDESYSKDEFD